MLGEDLLPESILNIVMRMKYSPINWEELPPCQVRNFGITVISNQLVLVGGQERMVTDIARCWVCGELTVENGHTPIQRCPQHDQGVLQSSTGNG